MKGYSTLVVFPDRIGTCFTIYNQMELRKFRTIIDSDVLFKNTYILLPFRSNVHFIISTLFYSGETGETIILCFKDKQ